MIIFRTIKSIFTLRSNITCHNTIEKILFILYKINYLVLYFIVIRINKSTHDNI